MLTTANSLRGPERRRLDAWKGHCELPRPGRNYRPDDGRSAKGFRCTGTLHEKLGSVYAFTDEIDEWWKQRSRVFALSGPKDPGLYVAVAKPRDDESAISAPTPAIVRRHGVWWPAWSAAGILLDTRADRGAHERPVAASGSGARRLCPIRVDAARGHGCRCHRDFPGRPARRLLGARRRRRGVL